MSFVDLLLRRERVGIVEGEGEKKASASQMRGGGEVWMPYPGKISKINSTPRVHATSFTVVSDKLWKIY